MTRGYLLDTNAVIDELAPPGDRPTSVSILTMVELVTGINATRAADATRENSHRHRRYRRLEILYVPLPVTQPVLDAYWSIDAQELRAGRVPRKRRMDLLIAATAIAHDLTVFTSNADDYRALHDLVDVESPHG